MPAKVAQGANGAGSSRFELPALDLNFGSITEGTNIPPPPDSPVEKPVEKPSQTEANLGQGPKTAATQGPAAGTKEAGSNGNLAGTKRPAEDVPPSPTVSNRPGSLRRLLSRTLLNNSYAEGQVSNGNEAAPSVNESRPPSRSGFSFMDDRKSKRSSGWFRRLRGGESKRMSFSSETPSTNSASLVNKGPPPPMIPELKELEKDEGSLGNDLFKNIK